MKLQDKMIVVVYNEDEYEALKQLYIETFDNGVWRFSDGFWETHAVRECAKWGHIAFDIYQEWRECGWCNIGYYQTHEPYNKYPIVAMKNLTGYRLKTINVDSLAELLLA